MMAVSAKPRALVFWHSFVRRFIRFIDNSQQNDLYHWDLQLVHMCEVKIFGTGGCTVDKTIRFDLDAIRGTAPNVVVLEMGSNDACEKDDCIVTSSANGITDQRMQAAIYGGMPDSLKETSTFRAV